MGTKILKRHFVKRGEKRLPVIGMTEHVTVAGRYFSVPAKIDTGADSSSIWASNITITPDDALEFCLFDVEHKMYDGYVFRYEKGTYEISVLQTSTGEEHCRYRVHLPMTIAGRRIRASVTLADRSKNSMPILVGRSTISGKFLVDVTFNPTGRKRRFKSFANKLTREMLKNPRDFHRKYKLGGNKKGEKK